MTMLNKLTYIFTLLVIGFTPLDAIEISDGITLGRYFFVLMIFFAILSQTIILNNIPKFLKLLICFFIWASFTTIWSINIGETFERVLYLVQYLLIVIVMLKVLHDTSRLRMAMLAWILGTIFIAFKTAIDFQTNEIYYDKLYRVEEFGNPNENSFMLCYALLFCFIIDKTKYRVPSLTLIALSVYAIIANGSQMGIILFILSIIGFCIQLWQNKKHFYVILLVPLIIAGGMYVLDHIPPATLSRIMGITENLEQGSFTNREDIWAVAWDILLDNPQYVITGSGWGTFAYAMKRYSGEAIGAHNFYLDVLFTTGIIGLCIVCYYLITLLRLTYHTYKSTIMNYLLLILPLISMMSTNWQSRRWWFLMGAFIYLIYKNKNFTTSNEVAKT